MLRKTAAFIPDCQHICSIHNWSELSSSIIAEKDLTGDMAGTSVSEEEAEALALLSPPFLPALARLAHTSLYFA